MQVTLGKEGLDCSWQDRFEENVKCIHCGAIARIAFVAHEGIKKKPGKSDKFVCDLHNNDDGKMWLHDFCAVAVYFCEECLEATAEYNQA